MIDVRCPQCATVYHADPAHAGKRIRCTRCDYLISIPDKREPTSKHRVETVSIANSKHQRHHEGPSVRRPMLFWAFALGLLIILGMGFLLFSYRHSRVPASQALPAVGATPAEPTQAKTEISVPSGPSGQQVDFEPEGDGQLGAPARDPNGNELETGPRPPIYNSLPTGTRIEDCSGGHGKLTVQNGTSEDAVARLYDTSTDQVCSFFVKAGSAARIAQIPEGNYQLAYTGGLDWSESEEAFRWHPSYAEFEQTLHYSERNDHEGVHYLEVRVTLHPVIGGNVRTRQISR